MNIKELTERIYLIARSLREEGLSEESIEEKIKKWNIVSGGFGAEYSSGSFFSSKPMVYIPLKGTNELDVNNIDTIREAQAVANKYGLKTFAMYGKKRFKIPQVSDKSKVKEKMQGISFVKDGFLKKEVVSVTSTFYDDPKILIQDSQNKEIENLVNEIEEILSRRVFERQHLNNQKQTSIGD